MTRSAALRWGVAIAAVLVLAAVFATGVRVFMPPAWGAPVPWSRTYLYNLGHFATWAALTPMLVRLAIGLPLERWRWTVPVQIVASCAIAVGQLAITEVVLSQLVPAGDPVRPSLADGIRFSLAINFQTAVMTYWAITGAVYAYGFHRREVELRATAADEQWKTLESHLAPHFLFNALASVTTLVDHDPPAAKRLVVQLGDLLRQSLAARERHTLTLDEELDSVTRYLGVEQARFADRLVVAIEADAGARRCQVPAFLLQPLVENAIQHGLQPSIDPVTISVRAHLDRDRLTVEIHDDAAPVSRTPGQGFGLERTKARLDRLYGPAYRFDAASATRGFRVDIEIPATEHRS